MARRKIFLHGSLNRFAPNGLELEADTVIEAVNGVCKVLGIKPNPISGRMTVKVLGFDSLELLHSYSDTEELHIVPAFHGRGFFGDVVKIVVGAVLIAASFIPGIGPLAAGFLFNMGATLVLGGLMNMLFPQKVADTGGYLGPPGNTTAIGTPISLVFGTTQVYGQILSYNVDAIQK